MSISEKRRLLSEAIEKLGSALGWLECGSAMDYDFTQIEYVRCARDRLKAADDRLSAVMLMLAKPPESQTPQQGEGK